MDKKYSLLLLDCYGTILSLPRGDPYRELFRLIEIKPAESAEARLGISSRLSFSAFCRLLEKSAPSGKRIRPGELACLQKSLQQILRQVRVYDDAWSLLQDCRSKGVPVRLVSNLAPAYVAPIHESGLSAYFEELILSCRCGLTKPDPAIFRLATAGHDPAACLMIGDSLKSDYEGALRSGLDAALLVRDGRIIPGVRQIRSLTDLIAII